MAFRFSKQQVLAAIPDSYGIVSQIARKLNNCAWHTAWKYVNRWEETRQAYQDENERSLDFTEGQLLARIKDGDSSMIKFHLMTKGKHRGYVERQEVTGAEGREIVMRVIYGDDGTSNQTPEAAPEAG